MTIYPIAVSGPRLREKEIRKKLSRYGLINDGIDFSGQVTKRKYKKIQKYCDEVGLTFRMTNALGRRRSDYRSRFFRAHKPDLGKRYICVYCGKLMKKDKVTVDHLYPVGCASRDVKLQKRLERQDIRNINDPRNLVASCQPCNARKGDRMGLWILRGKLGRHKAFWGLLVILAIAAIVAAGICLWNVGIFSL